MRTTKDHSYKKESAIRPIEEMAFTAGRVRAVAGGSALTAKQLASRLRVSVAKAALVLAVAQDGYDSIKTEGGNV
jgi:hypothetical protein